MDAEQRPRAWPSPDAHTVQAVEVAFRAWAGARGIGLRLGGLFGLPPAVYDGTMRLQRDLLPTPGHPDWHDALT